MSKKKSVIARLFRARLGISFHVLQKVIRRLGHSDESRGALVYGDHEFSFDETPIVHVKMHRPCSYSLRFKMPHFPCIQPQVHFDCDFGDEYDHACADEEGIDVKAENFIADFYRQRQISYLQ